MPDCWVRDMFVADNDSDGEIHEDDLPPAKQEALRARCKLGSTLQDVILDLKKQGVSETDIAVALRDTAILVLKLGPAEINRLVAKPIADWASEKAAEGKSQA
jgi:hypothetical protein